MTQMMFVGDDLRRVGVAFDHSWLEELLDFGEGVEFGLALVEERVPERPALKDEVLALLQAALLGERDVARTLSDLGLRWASEGPSRHRMLQRVLARYEGGRADLEVVRDATLDDVTRRFLPPQHGTFLDQETAEGAITLVLRQHEQRVRSWAVDGEPFSRLVLRGDVGRPVGHLLRADEDPEETSFLTVLMLRTPEGSPYIRGGYPDLTPDPRIAEAYLDLPQLFAGHFGQDWTANDGTPWAAEVAFHEALTAPATDPAIRRRFEEQLDAMLASTSTQDEMRHALTSLGSAILPGAARQWVQRMRGRIDPTIWHPEHLDV